MEVCERKEPRRLKPADALKVGAVVIGRNEGARLVAGLTSLEGKVERVVEHRLGDEQIALLHVVAVAPRHLTEEIHQVERGGRPADKAALDPKARAVHEREARNEETARGAARDHDGYEPRDSVARLTPLRADERRTVGE